MMRKYAGYLLAWLILAGAREPWAVGQQTKPTVAAAWEAWGAGEIEQAGRIAQALPESDERWHVLFLCEFVQGRYEAALRHHRRISPSYRHLGELDRLVVEALLHLKQYGEALEFANQRPLSAQVRSMVAKRARHPLRIRLERVSEIPFAEQWLSAYLPAFQSEVNGQSVVAHLDTGGTFLHMGLDRAKALGIELQESEPGFHGPKQTKTYFGIAERFRLGDALLENVPVIALPTLRRDQQDLVIFGTNVLEQFLTTVDYKRKRLILSRRGDPRQRKAHLAMLPGGCAEVPFYLWKDHYMFARGGFGQHKGLNFFIDTGLVYLALDSKTGRLRQACFQATPENYTKWGVEPSLTAKEHFESALPISLGPLSQTGQFFTTVKDPSWSSLGGVRIDGMLSHGFFNRYVWTLDFDTHRYILCKP